MSTLEYNRTQNHLRLIGTNGIVTVGPYPAFNNIDSRSKGPWPAGTFPYQTHLPHQELADSDAEYGLYGILIFSVPGRTGMGVHSGRKYIPDGLGRIGPEHCTLGCIRTTDAAMKAIIAAGAHDPLAAITVLSDLTFSTTTDLSFVAKKRRPTPRKRNSPIAVKKTTKRKGVRPKR